MQLFRSILFALVFYPATLLFAAAGLVASIFSAEHGRRVVHAWADFFDLICRTFLGVRVTVTGSLPAEPHMIAVKHQSAYETIAMMRLANTPVVVMKRQLTQIPFFGWMTRRYGVIPVDREAGAKALRTMLTLGRAAIAGGRSVMIYPEGTRVAPGEHPGLRAGFAGLYRALNVPVIPVAVDSGRLWGRGFVKQAGTIRFSIGKPIPAGLPREEIEARVHRAINALD